MLCEVTQIWGLAVTAHTDGCMAPLSLTRASAGDHMHLVWTVSQRGGGREARPGFLQIAHSSLQLFQAFKSLGLAQDT